MGIRKVNYIITVMAPLIGNHFSAEQVLRATVCARTASCTLAPVRRTNPTLLPFYCHACIGARARRDSFHQRPPAVGAAPRCHRIRGAAGNSAAPTRQPGGQSDAGATGPVPGYWANGLYRAQAQVRLPAHGCSHRARAPPFEDMQVALRPATTPQTAAGAQEGPCACFSALWASSSCTCCSQASCT